MIFKRKFLKGIIYFSLRQKNVVEAVPLFECIQVSWMKVEIYCNFSSNFKLHKREESETICIHFISSFFSINKGITLRIKIFVISLNKHTFKIFKPFWDSILNIDYNLRQNIIITLNLIMYLHCWY